MTEPAYLSTFSHVTAPYKWSEEWVVFGEDAGWEQEVEHTTAQFHPNPKRQMWEAQRHLESKAA